jgi:hypothetical protein
LRGYGNGKLDGKQVSRLDGEREQVSRVRSGDGEQVRREVIFYRSRLQLGGK